MNYMLLICDGEKGWAGLTEAERQQRLGEFGRLRQEIAGQYVAGSQLHPTLASCTAKWNTRHSGKAVCLSLCRRKTPAASALRVGTYRERTLSRKRSSFAYRAGSRPMRIGLAHGISKRRDSPR
jgi:hypothetical protein